MDYNVVMFELGHHVYLNYLAWRVFTFAFMLQCFSFPKDPHHSFELVDLHRICNHVHLVYVEKAQ